MAEPETGLIKVVALYEEEVPATGADLFVLVRGSSLVGGDEALKKAREVRQLVEDLGRVGVGEESIQLQRVSAESSSGVILKTSSASYELRIRCATTAQLGDAIGAIAGQKHIELRRMVWRYADDDEARNRWVVACIARANQRARAIAEALGVRLLGVHSMVEHLFHDGVEGNDQLMRRYEQFDVGLSKGRAGAGAGAMAWLSSEDFGLALSHLKQVTVQVEVEYRVSGFDEAA